MNMKQHEVEACRLRVFVSENLAPDLFHWRMSRSPSDLRVNYNLKELLDYHFRCNVLYTSYVHMYTILFNFNTTQRPSNTPVT